MRVEGLFPTRYGLARFSIHEENKAGIFIGTAERPAWTIHGVEYTGLLTMLFYGEKWVEMGGTRVINRVDGKPINFRTNTLDNIVTALTGGFAEFMNHPDNAVVYEAARYVALNNQLNVINQSVEQAREKLRAALDQSTDFRMTRQTELNQLTAKFTLSIHKPRNLFFID